MENETVDEKVLASRVAELEKKVDNARFEFARDLTLAGMGVLTGYSIKGCPQESAAVKALIMEALAGAHAEEKPNG